MISVSGKVSKSTTSNSLEHGFLLYLSLVKDLVEKAKKSTLEQYEKFKEVAKGPYIIYPDGSSMADGIREQFKAIYEKRIKQANMPPESQNKYSIPDPSKSFPKEL